MDLENLSTLNEYFARIRKEEGVVVVLGSDQDDGQIPGVDHDEEDDSFVHWLDGRVDRADR